MTPHKRRFSRRTLSIIIAVTAIAIALLSRLEPPERSKPALKEKPAPEKTNVALPPVKQY